MTNYVLYGQRNRKGKPMLIGDVHSQQGVAMTHLLIAYSFARGYCSCCGLPIVIRCEGDPLDQTDEEHLNGPAI